MGKWNKAVISVGTSSYSSPNEAVFGRNLTKDQLGGVIFGCKNTTMKECLSKQLFGLPSQHFSYVKNIKPGMPLFLFNYSDRTLHGIFEAASSGRMYIDRYGWTTDGSEVTQFPAQVQICVRCQCQPLPEDKFGPAIEDNYYVLKHFWFELDHGQASRLISLMKPISIAPVRSVPQNTKWTAIVPRSRLPNDPWGKRENEAFKNELCGNNDREASKNDPWGKSANEPFKNDPWGEGEAFKMPESELEQQSIHSSMISGFSEDDFSSDAHIQPLDTHTIDKEEAEQNEKGLIFMKLKELAHSRVNQNLSWEDNVSDPPDANDICLEGETSETPEKEENPISPPVAHQYNIAQLVQEVKDLTIFKETQIERNYYMEQKLIEAELEIQNLQERVTLLESTCIIPMTHVKEEVTNASVELHIDPIDSLFLIGGSDGNSSLATMDLYCTSQNAIKSLKPMSSARLYASAVWLNGEIYVFGGGDDYDIWYDTVELYDPVHDNWTSRPSLNQKKGSMSGVALNEKIFAIGGGNGVDCLSDVEMLDIDIGRWIPTRSMLSKRFALAAVELNGAIYATGGFDGNSYLNSAERFDPREHSWTKIPSMNINRGCHSLVVLNEKLYALGGFDREQMVSSVEVFDPRFGTWTMGEAMNHPRGYFAAAVAKESIYVIGGVQADRMIVETVENYKEGQGWEETHTSANVKRCFLSAIAGRQ